MAISLDLKSLDLKKIKSINPVQAGGVLALLVALWMAWQGFQISAAYRLEAGAASARSGLAEKLGPVTKLAIAQMEAAVVSPFTLTPNRRMAPAPRKPMPVTTCAAILAGSPF